MCKLPESTWNLADLLMTQVRQASTEILIATRRFEFDAFGQMLLSELEYACQRGLRVCCLLDAEGSSAFIADHPVLFTALETRFRIYDLAGPATRLVFDRDSAVSGEFVLCRTLLDGEYRRECSSGAEAYGLAQAFDACWDIARDRQNPGA